MRDGEVFIKVVNDQVHIGTDDDLDENGKVREDSPRRTAGVVLFPKREDKDAMLKVRVQVLSGEHQDNFFEFVAYNKSPKSHKRFMNALRALGCSKGAKIDDIAPDNALGITGEVTDVVGKVNFNDWRQEFEIGYLRSVTEQDVEETEYV